MLRETAEGWIYEVKDKTVFDPASIRRLELSKTMGAIVGRKPGSTLMEIQAIRFAKSEFDRAKVEEWVSTYMRGAADTLELLAKKEIAPAQALGISSGEQKVMAALGLESIRKGKLDRAKKIFEGLITLNPLSNLGHTGLGKVFQAQKQPDAAMNAFKEAVKHNPSDCDALLGQAEILLTRGQKKPALPLLLQVLAVDRNGLEPAGRTANRIVAEKFTNDDLKDFLQWGEQKLHQMAKEQLKAQGKAVMTLSGAPTAAAVAAGAARPAPVAPPRPLRG
jgi:tetratricopeptide (TPR) repeat protein